MFRFVPTMRCNFRCDYCFVDNNIKKNGKTMFDQHPVEEWINAIDAFDMYNIELYMWGGEPFCIDGTYALLRELTKRSFVIPGIRIDTNLFYADKIAELCPSNKIKLNCSYHMQYHTLDEELRKVCKLKALDMIGMVNFVASEYNLIHLRDDYGMTVADLVEIFAEKDVFLNVAGDFKYTNNNQYERYDEYKEFILQFISEREWNWLRGKENKRECIAGSHMFTVEYNGDFSCCIDNKVRGNYFKGTLDRDISPKVCDKSCKSLVSYPFRCDNDFSSVNSLLAYVERSKSYRRGRRQEYIDFEF